MAVRFRRTAIAGVVVGALWAAALPSGVTTAAGSLPGTVTAGSAQIAFPGSAQPGAIGSVGGYVEQTFDLETGQGGNNFYGGADLTLGTDANGQPTLTGTLSVVPPGATTAPAPASATVTVSAGEVLLVLDSAGHYALVQIQSATPQTVSFSYELQSAVTTVTVTGASSGSASQSAATSASSVSGSSASSASAASSPSASSSAASSAGASGPTAHTAQGNCLAIADASGQALLGVGFTLAPEFSGDSLQTAIANDTLLLSLVFAAPTDITDVTGQQSGQVGGSPWTQRLSLLRGSGDDWVFHLDQTDHTQPYQFYVTSQALASAGLADPSTGATEIDWNFNTDGSVNCSSQSVQGAGGASPTGTPSSTSSTSSTSSAPAGGPITVSLQIGSTNASVNGQSQSMPVAAQIMGQRTMVPLRFLADALGAQVAWDGTTRTVTYILGSTQVVLQIGSNQAQVDGQAVALDAPATIVEGSTLVPARFVSQELGAAVAWDGSTQTVTITYPAPSSAAGAVTAATSLASQYECGSFSVSGGGAGSCSLMPRLQLNSGGSYTWGSESGTCQSAGGRVTFTGSLGAWGPGELNSSGQIVFQFDQNGKAYVVTYYPA